MKTLDIVTWLIWLAILAQLVCALAIPSLFVGWPALASFLVLWAAWWHFAARIKAIRHREMDQLLRGSLDALRRVGVGVPWRDVCDPLRKELEAYDEKWNSRS